MTVFQWSSETHPYNKIAKSDFFNSKAQQKYLTLRHRCTETCLWIMITNALKVSNPQVINLPFFPPQPNMEFSMEARSCKLLESAGYFICSSMAVWTLACFRCTVRYLRPNFKGDVKTQSTKQWNNWYRLSGIHCFFLHLMLPSSASTSIQPWYVYITAWEFIQFRRSTID